MILSPSIGMYLQLSRRPSRSLASRHQEVSFARVSTPNNWYTGSSSALSCSIRFLADKYKLDMSSAANLNHVNKAIARGVEVGVFDQPKGAGGKVKIVKKVRTDAQSMVSSVTHSSCSSPIDRLLPARRTRRTLPPLLLLPPRRPLLPQPRRRPLLLPLRRLLPPR